MRLHRLLRCGKRQTFRLGGQTEERGDQVELFPEWSDERFPLYAIYPSRLHRAAKVRVFIEFCMEVMAGPPREPTQSNKRPKKASRAMKL
jgi:hypothetical protein